MNAELFKRLTAACESEAPREERARNAAILIAAGGDYRRTGIYEVDDDRVVLLGEHATDAASAGAPVKAETLASSAFLTTERGAIVPILGAESGVAIGALAVEHDRSGSFDDGERAALERCAAIVIALFE
jgi:hypothetical protein